MQIVENQQQTLARQSRSVVSAFTLTELMVVIAIISLLAGLILSSLSAATQKGRRAVCINNLKQLHTAWIIYTDDNDQRFPVNDALPEGNTWRSTPDSWTGPSCARVDETLDWIKHGSFMRQGYIGSAPSFHCPSDDSTTLTNQVLRTRSYAVSGYLGGVRDGVNDEERGAWNGAHFAKSAQLEKQTVSEIFAFIDEDESTIDDGHFKTTIGATRWENRAATRHSVGANLSFLDGHVEFWKWRSESLDELDMLRLQKALPNILAANK